MIKSGFNSAGIIACLLFLTACPVRPELNINGSWNRGTKASIQLRGNSGTLTGENGAAIPVKVEYLPGGKILIREYNHTPEFLENYIPRGVAVLVYTNQQIRQTYYIVSQDTNGIIQAQIHAWEVFYDHDYRPYYVIPKTFTETWGQQQP